MSHDVHWRESVSDVVGGTRVSERVSRMGGGGGGEHVPREILQLESSYSIREFCCMKECQEHVKYINRD